MTEDRFRSDEENDSERSKKQVERLKFFSNYEM
jgi:hypothetical protein